MLKRLSFFLTLACLSALGSRAATVSGTITNGSLSAPAASQKIYLIDSVSSSGQIIDSTNTNSSGAYSFTVSSSISTTKLRIGTIACSAWNYSSYQIYSGSNLTMNLSICAPVTITGTVSYSGSLPASGMKVYVMDSVIPTGITYLDSTLTNSSGQYSINMPSTHNTYKVFVKACGSRFASSLRYTYNGNATINFTLSCPWTVVRDSVYNSTTGLPVYGQKVYLVDSTATSYRLDSVLTDVYGYAYFNMPPTSVSGTKRVYTNACGVQSQSFTYSGVNMVGPAIAICLSNAVLSGTVTNATTSAVVPNQVLVIYDSTTSAQLYVDSARTDASGNYSVPVPVYVPATGTMIVATNACGIRHTSRGSYSGSNKTLNLAICATSVATVSGTVTIYGTSTPVVGRKVYLFDTILVGGGIISRDSTVTNSAGFYSFTVPPSKITAWLKVGTPSCGNAVIWYIWGYSGQNINQSFTVCNTTGLNTVTGTVLNANGAPAGGRTINLTTSIGTVTAITNSSGAYSLSIPANVPLGTNMTWFRPGPCNYPSATLVHRGVNYVRNDTIPASCHTISGTVTKQGGGAAANAKVLLIGEMYDSSFTPVDTSLMVIDSVITDANGRYSLFNYYISWPWPQRVKAFLQTSDPDYWNYLPTYHDSSLTWNGAKKFDTAYWNANNSSVNVSLRAGTNPGGPGFIGGRVLVGANKSTSVGDPLAERILLLTTEYDAAVGYTYSDASGTFSFPNLPYGTYKLFGDAGGKANPALFITLSASGASVTDVVFEENNVKFEGHVGNVGVHTQKADAVHLYPNPAGAYITLNGLNSIKGSKTIVVRNVAGAVVYSTETESKDAFTIATEKLPAGVYMLQLHSDDGVRNMRFVKN